MPSESSNGDVDEAPEIIPAKAFVAVAPKRRAAAERWSRAATVAAIVVPALAVLYVLTVARPVTIQLVPDDAVIALSGSVSVSIGDRRFMRPGKYLLRASAPGYIDLRQEIEITSASGTQQLRFELVPIPVVTVTPNDPSAGGTVTNAADVATPGDATADGVPTAISDAPALSDPSPSSPEIHDVADESPSDPSPPPRDNVAIDISAEAARPETGMVTFDGARYTMGSSRREHGRRANEVLRDVVLSRPFAIAAHEVTNRSFREFNPSFSSGMAAGETLDDDVQPVANIPWSDAARYCNWLSERSRLPPFYRVENGEIVGFDATATGYRLPSEAEWEWAARSGADGQLLRFPWGMDFAPSQKAGNFADRSAVSLLARLLADYDDGFAVSAPPGSFSPNAFGLYDMGGNVAEWVHDVYDIDVPDPTSATENPLGKMNGRFHAIRGSSWAHAGVTELRLAFRDYSNGTREDVGFRVARYLR